MKNHWLNKRKETTVNPIVNFGAVKFDFRTLERDKDWKRQYYLLSDEIAEKILEFQSLGLDPHDIDFKEFYAKYPKVRVGIRRLLIYVQKHYGIKI